MSDLITHNRMATGNNIDSGYPPAFKFGDFMLETNGPALYHRGCLVDGGGKKTWLVLGIFLSKPNRLVTYDEIIKAVWGEERSSITSDNVNQYVRQLRKIFSDFEPECEYFKNIKGRGYEFIADVEAVDPDATASGHVSIGPRFVERGDKQEVLKPRLSVSSRIFSRQRSILIGLVILVLSTLGFWIYSSPDDDDEIRRVVQESQLYESLVLYKEPENFAEEHLDKYWTPDLDLTANYDRRRIRESVKKLASEDRKYGDGTKCVRFEFQSVEISKDKLFATVRTLEEWFLVVQRSDGALLRNRVVGPYFVDYILAKKSGRWLIERSTTASVVRPRPQLAAIIPSSDIQAGKESYIEISGHDFEPETIHIEIVGPGCPEVRPCRVPNEILRKHAMISATSLKNVPVNLTRGEFRVFLYNADSQPSLPATLVVQ